jgi:hypothetical protein
MQPSKLAFLAFTMGFFLTLNAGAFLVSVEAKTFAALAVVPKQGRVYHGYAKRDSLQKARTAALRKCAHSKCIIVQDYELSQCVHLVLGNNQIFWSDWWFGKSHGHIVLDECSRVDDHCVYIVTECLK